MSNSARKANPKVDLGPDYWLRIGGVYYVGLLEGSYAQGTDIAGLAKKLKGPGLASAERALKRRGYIVERVRVEE